MPCPSVTDGPTLRYLGNDAVGWQTVDVEGGIHGSEPFTAAIAHVVDCLNNGTEPDLSARNALCTTEVIFAAYESSRRRARIDLPLDVDDSALIDLLRERTCRTQS